MRKIKGKGVAFRPAFLVNAKYQLSRREDDIINILLSVFVQNESEYNLNLNLFSASYNTKRMCRNYKLIEDAVETLKEKFLEFEFDNETYSCKWVDEISYIRQEKASSFIQLKLNPILLKFLNFEKLQGVYYKTEHANNIDSDLGRRLFYNLQMFLGHSTEKWKTEKINKLQDLYCLNARADHFKILLEKAIKEINNSSNFFIEAKNEKEKSISGQMKLSKIQFHIMQKTKEEMINFNKK